MRYEYIVDLDVTAADGRSDPRPVVEGHLERWLRRKVPDAPDLTDIEGRGTRSTVPEPGGRSTTVEWESIGDDRTRAVRLSLRVPQQSSNASHVTRVTIGSTPEDLSVRIAMGPEVPDGQLAPVGQDYLRSPGLIRDLARDGSIQVHASKQLIDERYDTIRKDAEVDVVIEALSRPRRLPVLVVSGQGDDQWSFARRAARELPGLARVVVLGKHEAWQRFNVAGCDTSVPYGGARLVWGLDVEHQPSYPAEKIRQDPAGLTTALLEMLGRSSVASRSSDKAWVAALMVQRRVQTERADATVAAARANGDDQAAIDAVMVDRDEWRALAEDVTAAGESLETELEDTRDRLRQAQATNRWWSGQQARLESEPVISAPALVDWSTAPALGSDAGALYRFLTRSSSGAIVFDDHALRSWTRGGFNFPDKMRDALVALAHAAVEWRERDGLVGSRMQDWFRLEHGLEYAATDTKVARSKVALFGLDGRRLDAEPHIKLGDNKTARDIGRIYFALDEDEAGKRFVVRHVGVHDLS